MNLVQPHRRNPCRRRAPPKRFEDKNISDAIKRINEKDKSEVKKPKKVDTVSGNQKYYTYKSDLEEECHSDSRFNKK